MLQAAGENELIQAQNLSRNVQQEQRERIMGRTCGAEGGLCPPAVPVLPRVSWALVCDQTWPPTFVRTNAVPGTEDPEFHPNPINSPVLPRIFLWNLHVKLVMALILGGKPTSVWSGQVCSVSPALDSDLRSDKSQKGWKRSRSNARLEAQRAERWNLAENHQALLSPFPLNLTGKGK